MLSMPVIGGNAAPCSALHGAGGATVLCMRPGTLYGAL